MLKRIDMDKNGKINFNEFVASCLPDDICSRKDYLDYVFEYFNTERTGKITLEELERQIAQLGL